MSRPLPFSQETADVICERLAQGETLTGICQTADLPSVVTVWRWSEANEDFRKALGRAREAQARHWADEIIDLADDSTDDLMTETSKDGKEREVFNRQHVERVKLRIQTRQWLMTRIAPKEWGDKLQVDSTVKVEALGLDELKANVTEKLARLGLPLPDFKALGLGE